MKLISINYWAGIFFPIVNRQLRQKYGIKIAYVDTMAGSGVTSTKRAGDFLCGSCPDTVLYAYHLDIPLDIVHAVEINKVKAEALKKRLSKIEGPSKIKVWPNDILEVSQKIANDLKKKTTSFIVIDPQALNGITWKGISPLLRCKGDAMLTWFEHEAWRVRCAAKAEHPAAEGQGNRLTELIGSIDWTKTKSPNELTDLFVNRVLDECGKSYEARVKIPRQNGGYYLMILFTGEFSNAEKLAKDWKRHLERRINSVHGREISSLLDVKAGRISSLDDF